MTHRNLFLYFTPLFVIPVLALLVAGFGYIDMSTWRAPIGFSLSAVLFGFSLVLLYRFWPAR